MPSFESATVMVMVGAGSRYEQKSNNGISHFLEHMAFKGTKSRPNAMAISGVIDGIGGEFNAFTGKEITGFYIKAQKTHLELLLDILSDMLKNSLLDAKEMEKEKGVIIEEINMYEDTPMRHLADVYEGLLYGNTPMGWDTAGTKEVIRSVARKDFVTYMQSLYSPDNMTVVVAGGVDEKKVLSLVKKYFADMKKFTTIKAAKIGDNQKKPAALIKTKQTEQVHIALGVRTVGLGNKDQYALEVLAAILGGGMSSRLFEEVREKRGLAYYVRTNSENYTDVGSLVTTAGVDPNRIEDAIRVIVEEYKKIRKSGNITKEELIKAKEYLKGHFVLELEDSRSVATHFAQGEILEKKIETPEAILAKIDKVTIADLERVTKTYIIQATLNLAIIGNFKDTSKFEKLLKI